MVRSVLRQAPRPAGLGHAGTHSLEHACTRRSVRQARRPAGLGHAGTHRSLEHACTRRSLGRGLRDRVDARRTAARIFARRRLVFSNLPKDAKSNAKLLEASFFHFCKKPKMPNQFSKLLEMLLCHLFIVVSTSFLRSSLYPSALCRLALT